MKYLGGKHRLGNEISNVLKHVCPESYKNYLEPFCGALGVFRHMTEDYNCLATDIQPDIILLWKEIKNRKFIPPKNVTETYYNKIKKLTKPSALRGFVGFLCSWNGMFFAGLAKYKNNRNVTKEAKNDINKIAPLLQKNNVKFKCMSYEKHNPKNTLIYCDPPYKDTIGYSGTKKVFDHEIFWNTIRKWSKNNTVIISEVTAPEDFVEIWNVERYRSAAQGTKTRFNPNSETKSPTHTIEKLFIHKSKYDSIKNLFDEK